MYCCFLWTIHCVKQQFISLFQSELHYTDVIQLQVTDDQISGPDGTQLSTLGCGTAIDFHKTIDYLFLVGTEEGKIQKCSKAYSSKYLNSFDVSVYLVAVLIFTSFFFKRN